MNRPNEPPLPDALAYFITWATYGTWLPGDERGWVEYRRGWQMPDPIREAEAAARMTEDACRLDAEERAAVQEQVAETCSYRRWELHAVNCRSNHMHIVVTAPVKPATVRAQLKAWCTWRLKALDRSRNPTRPVRENWWAERGSNRYVNDDLDAVIAYVRDGQDRPR